MNPGPARPEKNQPKDAHSPRELLRPGEPEDRVSPELPTSHPEKKNQEAWVNQLGPGPFSLEFSSQPK